MVSVVVFCFHCFVLFQYFCCCFCSGCIQFCCQFRVRCTQYLNCQQSRIFCAVNGYSCNGNTAGHLYGRKQCIQTVQCRGFYRNADDRQCCVGCNGACQMSCLACCRDDGTKAICSCLLCKLFCFLQVFYVRNIHALHKAHQICPVLSLPFPIQEDHCRCPLQYRFFHG